MTCWFTINSYQGFYNEQMSTMHGNWRYMEIVTEVKHFLEAFYYLCHIIWCNSALADAWLWLRLQYHLTVDLIMCFSNDIMTMMKTNTNYIWSFHNCPSASIFSVAYFCLSLLVICVMRHCFCKALYNLCTALNKVQDWDTINLKEEAS